MRNIRLTLLALVFGLSACSFSFASGPSPYSAYPQGALAAVHGRGKPARRVVRDAAPTIAGVDRPAKPAELDPEPDPPTKPMRVGRVEPPKPPPKPMRVGRVEPPKPMRVGRVEPPKPMRVGRVEPPKPESPTPMRVGRVEPPMVLLPVIAVDPRPTKP